MKIAHLARNVLLAGCATALVVACQSEAPKPAKTEKKAAPAAAKPAPKPPAAKAPPTTPPPQPRREALDGGPYPALLVSQAQFIDGPKGPVPGPAKLTIVRETPDGWVTSVVEDPDSNVFHKAMMYGDSILTIGANKAMLKTWTFADGAWKEETHWNPTFGGKFDRLRDVEMADVDGDGQIELVIATHDQGEIVIVHPDEEWRVEKIDAQTNTFVHEIELGDVDGDGALEIFATPSKPNKLDQEQPGEVSMYKRGEDGSWTKSIVDAPGDTHAKEILAANPDAEGPSELYIVWEGAMKKGQLVRPVTIKEYRMKDGAWESTVVTTVPDRQMRAIASGDVNADGKIDMVAGGLGSGLWLFEQGDDGWTKTLIDENSSGFEHPVLLADLDEDGNLEIYVGSEDQGQLRRYRWEDGKFVKTAVGKLGSGDITWNVQDGKL
ncbi:MAG: VCBS repeat-containing protein [Candidatus Binatia bacterium]|nr:VCBS repeat-containing protein [Candidatus Binatia bacterium]